MAKMQDDDLLRYLEAEASEAYHYNSGDVASSRNQALRDYLRFPYGNEQDGRSQVVASDVFDAVEGMLPDLVEVFVASDKAVVFDPVGPEDEEGTKQATDACNHVFYKQNNGIMNLYSVIKDGLLLRTGGWKWWWEVKRTPKFETFSGDEMQIAAHLAANPKAQVIGQEEAEHTPDVLQQYQAMMDQAQAQGIHPEMLPQLPARYTIRLKTVEEKGRVCLQPIPADELEVSARHNSILLDDCPYVCHKSKKTLSDLIQMGFDVTVDDVRAAQDENTTQDREFYDTIRGTDATDPSELDDSMVRGWIREEYVLVDYDQDGIAERRKIIRLGTKILENVEFSHVPIAAWTPYILTHKFDGLSVWDLVSDFQKIHTDIWRNQIDNLALANNQETVVLTDANGNPKANIDDLLNRRVGGVIRENVPNAVRPYNERWQGIEAMPMLEMLNSDKERRTGHSPVVPSIDADALNKTATEVSKQSNERQKRMKLMARIVAETLMKPTFKGILKTLTDYCMEKLSFRLNGRFVSYDPQEWKDGYDMSINVGIGSGDTMQQLQFLTGIEQAQFALAQSPFGQVLIDAEKIYNVQARKAELAGFKNPNEFWNAPKKNPDGSIVMPPPQPPVELQMKQMDMQADAQKEQFKGQITIQSKRAELELQAQNDARDAEREERRFLMEQELERQRIAADDAKHQREMQFRQWEKELDAATELQKAAMSAQATQNAATAAAEAEISREIT
jgi:hypothetical protein